MYGIQSVILPTQCFAHLGKCFCKVNDHHHDQHTRDTSFSLSLPASSNYSLPDAIKGASAQQDDHMENPNQGKGLHIMTLQRSGCCAGKNRSTVIMQFSSPGEGESYFVAFEDNYTIILGSDHITLLDVSKLCCEGKKVFTKISKVSKGSYII